MVFLKSNLISLEFILSEISFLGKPCKFFSNLFSTSKINAIYSLACQKKKKKN
jgi:hypothetical protein